MVTDNKKRVTVLTLSYNSPDLYVAIDSVLKQTYGNIQLIIVDDCSANFDKKDVIEFINRNNRGNITFEIVTNKENKGITRSSNIGIMLSDGEYIINLAGDDAFYDEEVVSDIVKEFEKTGALIITGLRSVRDQNLEKEYDVLPTKKQASKVKRFSPERLFEEISGCNFIFGCCTARSRTCIDKYGLYDERYFYLDDYSMNVKLLRNGVKFHFFERIFIKYRSNGISSITNINKNYIKESDLLFATEIEPYSDNPAKARKKYLFWKNKSAINREYLIQKNALDCNCLAFKIRYWLSHPLIAILLLKEKFDKIRGSKWKLKQ